MTSLAVSARSSTTIKRGFSKNTSVRSRTDEEEEKEEEDDENGKIVPIGD